MTTELAPIDTDVLVYSFFPGPPLYPASARLVDQAQASDAGFSESYAIMTNPHRVSTPFIASEALTELANLRALPGVTQLPVPLDIVDRWSALIAHRFVMGHDLSDVQSVAATLGNGVKKIYTFNVKDFTQFAELEAIEPPPPSRPL
jgi:predicted nucleic acid-binding protein